MKLRPITSEQYTELEEGYMLLLRAQAIFRRGDAPKTYEKVRSACTSAQGAIRHAQRRAQASGARLIVKLPQEMVLYPECSICRQRHPSDDRHPCE